VGEAHSLALCAQPSLAGPGPHPVCQTHCSCSLSLCTSQSRTALDFSCAVERVGGRRTALVIVVPAEVSAKANSWQSSWATGRTDWRNLQGTTALSKDSRSPSKAPAGDGGQMTPLNCPPPVGSSVPRSALSSLQQLRPHGRLTAPLQLDPGDVSPLSSPSLTPLSPPCPPVPASVAPPHRR